MLYRRTCSEGAASLNIDAVRPAEGAASLNIAAVRPADEPAQPEVAELVEGENPVLPRRAGKKGGASRKAWTTIAREVLFGRCF